MKKPTVLVDLNIAMNNGYCGIAKENRLIFKVLANNPSIETSGLLLAPHTNNLFEKFKKVSTTEEHLKQTKQFFHSLDSQTQPMKSVLSGLMSKRCFSLYPISSALSETVWLNTFSQTLSALERAPILERDFYFSDISITQMKIRSYINKQATLNTAAFNFALFPEPTSISVAPTTKKIVRYHDAIPITNPEFGSRANTKRITNTLKHCAKDSYFVCNTEPTRAALLTIHPELEQKSFVIPCLMTDNHRRIFNEDSLRNTLAARLSSQIISNVALGRIRHQILTNPTPNYIFNLAALEPRKNHITLIKAWESILHRHPGKLKLIIAANKGWMANDIVKVMAPHLETGNIIHLSNLTQDDTSILYSHAKAFIFPSHAEGFGLPPVEAMQCNCPTIVSNIPAHRWVMGDASLYCNPYEADSIAEAIEKLAFDANADETRAKLISSGTEQVKKYTENALAGKWAELFEIIT